MINHRVQKYIDHSFCSEYLFRDWEAFLDFIYEEGCRVSSILWWADIKAYIHETRAHGLILGDKYISHDLVPSFYLADEQTPVCRDDAKSQFVGRIT